MWTIRPTFQVPLLHIVAISLLLVALCLYGILVIRLSHQIALFRLNISPFAWCLIAIFVHYSAFEILLAWRPLDFYLSPRVVYFVLNYIFRIFCGPFFTFEICLQFIALRSRIAMWSGPFRFNDSFV